MAHRIEIKEKGDDTRAAVLKKKISHLAPKIKGVDVVDVYTVDAHLKHDSLERVVSLLTNPVTQTATLDKPQDPGKFKWAIEVGYLPGVTDNIANTARESLEDALDTNLSSQEGVYTSKIVFLKGDVSHNQAKQIAESIANPLIQRIHIKSYNQFKKEKGMDRIVPRVRLTEPQKVYEIDLNVGDDELIAIGKQGIQNPDGTRRGPLALRLSYMKAIQSHFRSINRKPTDIELESIAQTWSEHCKHTIFADPIDNIREGIFKHFIKRATEDIRKAKGDKDFCVSVFTDNSGAIVFDENYLITHKVETHNSPSALDPFGGSITGIVGVNRDTIGFGMGAKPVANIYGFCFANPHDKKPLFRDKEKKQKMLSPRRIMDGVIEGVNAGGNQSGIPTPQGFMLFDPRYKGKPQVFVGTVGLIPRVENGKPTYEKSAQQGDYIVMIGGKVGKDGIHGATFSSEALNSGSPATAVQIGDPITQKKLSDVIIREARPQGLYRSMTDNGAGGLSCSVAEMAKESGGCYVELEKVPLKYPGLQPWEILVSESQERMTLSVSPEKWEIFNDLMKRRGVEATVIGEFTNSGKCIVDFNGKRIMDIDMDFLHNGLPPQPLKTEDVRIIHKEPKLPRLENLTDTLHSMLRRPNIASNEFISRQYDHEVQGGSVLKPLQGRGRVNGDATVIRPLLSSRKGVVLSQGVNPTYSDIDAYHMAAAAIDTAVRNSVAAGGNLDHLAILDNFDWCSSNDPVRLGELKRAARACYDLAVKYGTPFISGKDSMFNDFKGFDEKGKPVQISIPPTLLISSISVMQDASKAVSLDAKFPGDKIYVLGTTQEELGASEYFAMLGDKIKGTPYIGNKVPLVNPKENMEMYRGLMDAIQKNLVSSAKSVHRGGLGIALAKTAMGGMLGMDISLHGTDSNIYASRDDMRLFSESQGRVVVTVDPKRAKDFESAIGYSAHYVCIGEVRDDAQFTIRSGGSGRPGNLQPSIIKTDINTMLQEYRSTFKDY